MYTLCTHDRKEIHFTGHGRVFDGMQPAITPYARHRTTCKHKHDRNHHRCNCPIWMYDHAKPRGKQRYSADTNDWAEAIKKAGKAQEQRAPIQRVTVEKAIDLYLIDRSKKAKNAKDAPFKDRYMLRDGSKKQQALLQMAEQEKIGYLNEITARQLNSWRNGWVFREKSYSQRGNNNVVKAFFKWAIRFDYLEKDPMSKLDAISVIPVPTLPLQNDEYPRMLTAVNVLPSTLQTKVRCHMLLMRWAGLAIRDASCLPVDALSPDNRPRTYRQKTGEYVYIKLPDFVADALRIEATKNIHPGYFFWQKSRMTGKSCAEWFSEELRKVYDAAGISPRGGHRFRDTFAVEFLNANGDIEDLARLLGHSNSNVTKLHYSPWVKSRQQHLDAAVDRNLAIQLPTHAPEVIAVQ